MHIGLIGGIGVAATVAYYERLTAALARRGKPLELTIVQAEINDLARNNLADDRAPQAAIYARLIARLKAAGADCAAITSIGGHFCFAETLPLSALPLVSAIQPLDAHFAANGVKRIGILGTDGVMRSRVYGQIRSAEPVVLEAEIETLGAAYRATAIAGHCTDENRALLIDAGRRLVEDEGADAVLLGGTDLGLAFDGRETGYRVIDAIDIHVDLLARLAAGEAKLEPAEAA